MTASSRASSTDGGNGGDGDDSEDGDGTYIVYWQRWVMLMYMSILNLMVSIVLSCLLYPKTFLNLTINSSGSVVGL